MRGEQRLVATYLGPDLLERAQSWGLIFVTLGVGIFLACLGAWLFLKPATKEIVKVEVPPAQVVKVEVPAAAPAQAPDMSQYIRKDEAKTYLPQNEPTKTSTGEPIQRQVTLFSSVAHENGEVVSGWIFKDGAAGSAPLNQYCYFATNPVNNSPTTRVNLAINGSQISFDQSVVPSYEAALQKCQWFDGAATKVTEVPTISRVTTSQVYTPLGLPNAPTLQTDLIPAETVAANEVRNFVEQWSDRRISIETIGNHYGASVFYFGKQTNHQDIIEDMQRNAQRWPIRRYDIYNNQITTTCGEPGVAGKYATPTGTGQICDVTAEIDWHVANGQRKVGGLTEAFYEIAVETSTGTAAIYAQTENVINRHPD